MSLLRVKLQNSFSEAVKGNKNLHESNMCLTKWSLYKEK